MDDYIDKYFEDLYDVFKKHHSLNTVSYSTFMHNILHNFISIMDNETINYIEQKHPIIKEIYNTFVGTLNEYERPRLYKNFICSIKHLKKYGKIYNINLRKEKLKKLIENG